MIKKLLNIIFVLILIKVFFVWFVPGLITGGDLWYFFPSMYSNHSFLPSSSLFFVNNSFGGSSMLFQAANFVMAIPLLIGKLSSLPWDLLERIFILFPCLIITPLSMIYFVRKIFPENNLYILSAVILTLNTYILMLVSGGLVVLGIAQALYELKLQPKRLITYKQFLKDMLNLNEK